MKYEPAASGTGLVSKDPLRDGGLVFHKVK